MRWEFGRGRDHLVAKIRKDFLKVVAFELDFEGPSKPDRMTTEEQKVIDCAIGD